MSSLSTVLSRFLSGALLALVACGPMARANDDPPAETAASGEDAAATPPPALTRSVLDEEQPPIGPFGTTGLDFQSDDGRFRIHLWFRSQVRYSYPFNSDPRSLEDFAAGEIHSFDLQRIRIKLKGNAYRPWLQYYFEYDFKSRMLNAELTLSRWSWLQMRVGQWKVTYNRERVDSSGKQQFADRSIVNREFTLDRQPGIMLAGHLAEGTPADVWYMAGLFNGNGANNANDDDHPMWMTRLQWSPLGRQLPFSQSDLSFHEKAAGTLAFGAVGNRGPYTRFATSGPGQVDGIEPGKPGRYDLRQYLEETAFVYRGFSFQQEWHWKEITDNQTGVVTNLQGAYAQAGIFPWSLSESLPRPLELAARLAWVDPDRSTPDDDRRELTFGANWFFHGHDNKVTADVSRLELDQPRGPTLRDHRFRLQWDISF